MKREILFRAKSIQNKEFIYGMPTYDFKYMFSKENMDSCDNYQVNPETVEQFTGLVDKNGTKIFEGDIVRYERQLPIFNMFEDDESGGEIVFVNHVVEYFLSNAEFSLTPIAYTDLMNESLSCCHLMEVVGNIHDKPERLESFF